MNIAIANILDEQLPLSFKMENLVEIFCINEKIDRIYKKFFKIKGFDPK